MDSLEVPRATFIISQTTEHGPHWELQQLSDAKRKERERGNNTRKLIMSLTFCILCLAGVWDVMSGRKLEVYVACGREGKGRKRGGTWIWTPNQLSLSLENAVEIFYRRKSKDKLCGYLDTRPFWIEPASREKCDLFESNERNRMRCLTLASLQVSRTYGSCWTSLPGLVIWE